MKTYKGLMESKIRHVAVHNYMEHRAKQHRSASKRSKPGSKESYSHSLIHHAYKHVRHTLMAHHFENLGDEKSAAQQRKLAAFHKEKMVQEGHNEAAVHQLSKE